MKLCSIFSALVVFAISLSAQEVVHQTDLRVDYDQPLRVLTAPKRFRAVGMVAKDLAEHFHVRLRHSQDGSAWSKGHDVELGHEGGALFWIEEGAQYVEIAAPRDVRILLIEPGEVSPVRAKSEAAAVESEVVKRPDWGCGTECTPRAAPVFAPVTHLVVHHSAGGNQASNWAAVVRSIWVLHVNGNGWNDIGYNYLIDPNGVIYEGRAGGDGVIGAHFSGVNTATMGVCMIGTYSTVPATEAAVQSLGRLLSWQAAKWKIDPSGQAVHAASGLTLNTISGHRDAGLSPRASGATECPGNALYGYLPEVRARVAREVPACRIQLARRNFCVGASGAAFELAFDNPSNCGVGAEFSADWLRLEGGKVVVALNSGAARSADMSVGGLLVGISQAGAGVEDPPCPARASVVNAASFDARPLGRNAIASVFGENLWREGGTTRVLINNNVAAVVVGATPNQVNFILPASVQPGSARLFVESDGVRSHETMFWVTEATPGIFLAQNHSDGGVNSPSAPVRAGEAIVAYMTGIGTDRNLPWQVLWDGQPIDALYLGPTPGFAGLAQANLVVPSQTEPGTHRLRVRVSGVPSQEIPVSVVR